jgi:hypothetical protein
MSHGPTIPENKMIELAVECAAFRERIVTNKLEEFQRALMNPSPNIGLLQMLAAELQLMDHRQLASLESMIKV